MDIRIFKTYTGNAMLNNALMTIESLAKLKAVSEVTPKLLAELYTQVDLRSVNKRLKSYTMLFTKNGPLHNDKTNGDKIYDVLMKTIISNFESDGSHICEISGLRFEKSFDKLYQTALKSIGISEKEIQKKDTNISRTWFPLIGGLGSDAQALPQAKFTVQIHPICILILQFLPLSALLYKGGILLVDSSNFGLARDMVERNTKIIAEKIQAVSVKESVENVRDYAKGDYLIRVLDILTEKEDFEEAYSDLNMWSFSNSGTGASCEIDRVPNTLIRKLQVLYKNSKIRNELKGILSRNERAYSFIECLEDNKDWFLLYPNVFGSGKKRVEYEGVSPDFLEAYYKVIGSGKSIDYAGYIAGLIDQYKSKSFEKFLDRTDAWNDPEYRIELYRVLVIASEKGKWSLEHQIRILDDNNRLPVKNHFYQLHKLIHYYYQKRMFSSHLPEAGVNNTRVYNACKWIISIIQNDSRNGKTLSDLTNVNEYLKVGYNRMIIHALESYPIVLENILEIFYDEDFNYSKSGLNELLRIFFLQPEQENYTIESWKNALQEDKLIQDWLTTIKEFTDDYKNYYCERYRHRDTLELPVKKFARTVQFIISENEGFYTLLNEAVYSTNQYLNENNLSDSDKWNVDALLCNPLGNYAVNISRLAIKFLLKAQSMKLQNEKEFITIINQ